MQKHLVEVVRLGHKDAYRCTPEKAKQLIATGRWEPASPPPVVKHSAPAQSAPAPSIATTFSVVDPITPAHIATAPKKKPE